MNEVVVIKYGKNEALLDKCYRDIDALKEKYKKSDLPDTIFKNAACDLIKHSTIMVDNDLKKLKKIAFETSEIPRTKSSLYKIRREFIEANKNKCDYEGLENFLYADIMQAIGHDVEDKPSVNLIWCCVCQIAMNVAKFINMCQY